MSFQLFRVKVHLPQIPARIPIRLVVEVLRLWMPALAARRHRPRPHLIAKLHHRHEAVAAGSIPLLRPRILPCSKRRQRTPRRRGEWNRNARPRIVERLHDISRQPLKPVDRAPTPPSMSQSPPSACPTRLSARSVTAHPKPCSRHTLPPERRPCERPRQASVATPVPSKPPATSPANPRPSAGSSRATRPTCSLVLSFCGLPDASASQAFASAGIGSSNHGR